MYATITKKVDSKNSSGNERVQADNCRAILIAIDNLQNAYRLLVPIFPVCGDHKTQHAWKVATEKILLIQSELSKTINHNRGSGR